MAQSLVVDGSQLMRLMKLVRAISSKKALTVQQLQKRLGASRRTIFRDLNAIQEMGIHVVLGEKGYTVKESATACKKLLAEHQVKALSKFLRVCLK